MPRQARLLFPGHPLHVVHRGVNRGTCFRDPVDHQFYVYLLQELLPNSGCDLHAFVLMTNHVHLLLTPQTFDAAARLMKPLAQRHSQRFNKRWQRSGPLWEGRYKSCLVGSERYVMNCYRYIEENPVRARMVRHPAEYAWSSFRANALGTPNSFLAPHPAFTALKEGEDACRLAYRALFDAAMGENELTAMREATRSGLAFGSQDFMETVAAALGRVPVRRNVRRSSAATA